MGVSTRQSVKLGNRSCLLVMRVITVDKFAVRERID